MFYKTKKENIVPNTSKIIMTHGLKYEQNKKHSHSKHCLCAFVFFWLSVQ